MTTPHLLEDIRRDEGCRLRAYPDPISELARTGRGSGEPWTVGYGHAHVEPGTVWTQDECEAALEQDVQKAVLDLDRNIPWWRDLNDARQDVLANMAFNMGWPTLSTFKNTLAAMKAGDYERAAVGMLASRWRQQVGQRAVRLAAQMRTGERPC